MKHIIIILALALSSCSVIKQSSKHKTETDTQTESDSSALVKSKVDTKVTETIDTVVRTPELKSSGKIVFHDKPIESEDAFHILTIKDGEWSVITKPQAIQVKKVKITETKAQTSTQVKENKKVEQSIDEKEKASEVKRTGVQWWLWLLLILGIVGYLVWKFRKRLPIKLF